VQGMAGRGKAAGPGRLARWFAQGMVLSGMPMTGRAQDGTVSVAPASRRDQPLAVTQSLGWLWFQQAPRSLFEKRPIAVVEMLLRPLH
jgi:hypothetical protein